jgi:hypothetical protein
MVCWRLNNQNRHSRAGGNLCLILPILIDNQVSPCRARYFSLATREKYPKERWPQGLPAKAGSLRFSQSPALAQLAISLTLDSLKQGASFFRALLRCSAAPRGEEHQNPIDTDYYHITP